VYYFNYIGVILDRDYFKVLLEKAGLSKKDFASRLDISYSTVNGWGSTQNIPYWVKSWLELYIKNLKFEQLKNAIKDSGACK
jgi:ribosome-binding protein aMBF1 (putative translation factor)